MPAYHRNFTWTAALFMVLNLCGCHHAASEDHMSPQEEVHAVAVLRDAYAAFNRNDIPAAVQNLDANIEWSEPAEFPGGGTYHGHSEVAGYLTQSRAPWAEGSSEPVQFIAHDNRIVVFVHAKFRAKDNPAWTETNLADVYTFRNGTPVAMRAFADRDAALAWVNATQHQ
jgi:ketosteroid isomerase-like protein